MEKPNVVLGVTGGIACYKALELVRLLVQDSCNVRVVMTREATEFVAPLSFQTLSGAPVGTDLFSLTQESEIGHINLADSTDRDGDRAGHGQYRGQARRRYRRRPPDHGGARHPGPLAGGSVHERAHAGPSDGPGEPREIEEKPATTSWKSAARATWPAAMKARAVSRNRRPSSRRSAALLQARGSERGRRSSSPPGPSREPLDPVRLHLQPVVREDGIRAGEGGRPSRRGGGAGERPHGAGSLPEGVYRTVPVVTAEEMRTAVLAEFDSATAVLHGGRGGGLPPPFHLRQEDEAGRRRHPPRRLRSPTRTSSRSWAPGNGDRIVVGVRGRDRIAGGERPPASCAGRISIFWWPTTSPGKTAASTWTPTP